MSAGPSPLDVQDWTLTADADDHAWQPDFWKASPTLAHSHQIAKISKCAIRHRLSDGVHTGRNSRADLPCDRTERATRS